MVLAAANTDEGEVLRTPLDKHKRMPRESLRRSNRAKPKPPALWHASPCQVLVPDTWGQLPKGFLSWVYGELRLRGSSDVLHVCSGALGPNTRGIRVDIRAAMRPDVVADGRALPFADESFDAVLIDPPYSVEYAENLYGTDYPRPSALLREASRVLRPSRRVAMLHFLVPMPEPGLRIVGVHGITTGVGYRIRALTVFEKEQRGLWRTQ